MKNKIFELEGIHFRNKNTQMIFHIIRPKDRQKVKFRKIKKKRFFFFFAGQNSNKLEQNSKLV